MPILPIFHHSHKLWLGLAVTVGLVLAFPLFASAEVEAVEPQPYDSYIYAALAFVGGLLCGLGILVLFRHRIDRLLNLLSRSTGHSAPVSYHKDSIAERVYGYFIWNRDDGLEWYSPYLRDLLLLDETVQGLEGMRRCLTKEDFEAIRDAAREFKEGYREHFERIVRVPRVDRYLECIGVQRHPPREEPGFTFWFRDVTQTSRLMREKEQEREETERTLQLMESMLAAVEFPLWKRDAELRIVYGNPAYRTMVGANTQQVLEGNLPELDARVRQLARKAQSESAMQTDEMPIITQGERKLFHVVELPLVQEGGGVTFLGYAFDASRQQEAEDERKRYASAMGDLLESSASAMAIYAKDQRLVSYNNAFLRLWKLEEEWLDDSPTYGEVLDRLRDKRLLPEQANFTAFKKENIEWFTRLLEPHEEFYYLPDGRVLRVIMIPHALGGLLISYEDVTDRLALERQYNTMLAVQRATLDHLHEAIVLFGENRRIKLYNPEYMHLWGLEKAFLDTEPHVADVQARCAAAVEEGQQHEVKQHMLHMHAAAGITQGRLRLKNGHVVKWRNSALPDGANLIAYSDVTDSIVLEQSLRERNLALEEADKVKTDFLANMSYELRSPLTSIMGFSEALISDYFGELNGKQREYVDAINQASHKLMSLINDILDLTTIAAGQMSLDMTEFSVRDMLEEVMLMLGQRAKEQQQRVQLVLADDDLRMRADDARVKQVLFNLLHNALKFSPTGAVVEMGARATHMTTADGDVEAIELWVRDEGKGIAAEEHGRVFERFFTSLYATDAEAGAGLGLAMVKRFTELHGGQVLLVSEEGKGTCVRCLYPMGMTTISGQAS